PPASRETEGKADAEPDEAVPRDVTRDLCVDDRRREERSDGRDLGPQLGAAKPLGRPESAHPAEHHDGGCDRTEDPHLCTELEEEVVREQIDRLDGGESADPDPDQRMLTEELPGLVPELAAAVRGEAAAPGE